MKNPKKVKQAKHEISECRSLFKELPYFSYTGYLPLFHGRFNNSLTNCRPTKNDLDKLTSLYDLSLFNLDTSPDSNLSPYENLVSNRIQGRYFSPNSFEKLKSKLTTGPGQFSIFHNNVVSLSNNLENLQTQLLEELDFHFDIIAGSETKITNANQGNAAPSIHGYNFESVPTPLSFGGVGMFIDTAYNYKVVEKTSNEAFQALWMEISFVKKKNIICGVIYRQHNTPELFQQYFDEAIEKFTASGKHIYICGDYNIDLLKVGKSSYSNDFLMSLQSCCLVPTIDKPTRVRRTSATLIDNILVNTPEQVSVVIRDFSAFSTIAFTNALSEVDWNEIVYSGGNDVDGSFTTFYNKFNKIVNKHAPFKTLSNRQIKQQSKPWITKGIRASIKVKNKLYMSGNDTLYKHYRNKIAQLVRLSKKNFFL